jgi:nucleoid-associated protein YgaU
MVQTAAPTRKITSLRPGDRHLSLYRPGICESPATSVRLVGSQISPRRHTAPVRRLAGASRSRAWAGHRLDPAVYRRRRLLVAGLFLLAIAAALILAQLIQAGIGGGPLTTTAAAAGPVIPAGATSYVVRPGDTLWTIAASIDPKGDERPLVDALSRETGGAPLYPGEHLAIPARW